MFGQDPNDSAFLCSRRWADSQAYSVFSDMHDSCKIHVVYTLCGLQGAVYSIVHLLYCGSKVKVWSSEVNVGPVTRHTQRVNTHVP
jgi:hypothetical protein